jgi:hypothetical protein
MVLNDTPRGIRIKVPSMTSISHVPADLQAPTSTASATLSNSAERGKVGLRHPALHASISPETDPWSSTIAALLQFDASSNDLRDEFVIVTLGQVSARPTPGNPENRTFTVDILEHLTNKHIVIAWHDSTLCNYEEQVWSPGLSGYTGWCALSGARIKRGDYVYSPRNKGQIAPLNGAAMILASALQKARDG